MDRLQNQIAEQQHAIIMTINEASAVIGKIETTLAKASTEILAKIEELKSSGELPPEASAALTRIETIATALDDIVPDQVTPEAPAPVITPIPAE